jgi:hypothetical protein
VYGSVAKLRLDPHGPRGVVVVAVAVVVVVVVVVVAVVVVVLCCCHTCSAWHPAKRCYHIWVIAVLWKYKTSIDIVLSNCI